MKMQTLFQSATPSQWFAITTMLVLYNFSAAANCSAQEIAWYPDVASATQAAKEQDKLLLMHFTADWCRPCQTLESFVFTSPSVQRAFHQNVIAVKIDVDENTSLVQDYGVGSVPSDVAVTPSGRVVSNRKSPKDSAGYDRMLAELGEITNGLKRGKSPALVQNLAELQEIMKNPNPEFEGQPTSFTPDAPTYQAPKPSTLSADLARKSRVVSNPYAQTESPPKVANAFEPAKAFDPPAEPADLPATPRESLPNDVHPKNVLEFNEPQSDEHQSVEVETSKPQSIEVQPADILLKAQQPGAASTPSDIVIKNNEFVSENGESPAVTPRSLALQRLEQSDVAARLVREKAQRKLNAFKTEPKTVMEDKFYGVPSPRQIAPESQNGNYQAKITMPGNNDFLPPKPPQFQADAQARIVADQNGTARTKAFNASHSIVRSPSSPIEMGLEKASVTPATPKYALHGKCPVTLLSQSKWIDGDPKWGCVHRNRIYIFTSEQNLKTFRADPDAHSPILAGYDPVVFHETGRLVDGLEKHGVFMGNTPHQRIVLFSNAETRARFQLEPRLYLDAVRQAMKKSGGASSELVR